MHLGAFLPSSNIEKINGILVAELIEFELSIFDPKKPKNDSYAKKRFWKKSFLAFYIAKHNDVFLSLEGFVKITQSSVEYHYKCC